MGQLDVPVMDQRCEPGEVSAGLRRELIDCWITVINAGGAAGFPFPPVDDAIAVPVADQLLASLSPGGSRLLLAQAGNALAGCTCGVSPIRLSLIGAPSAICRWLPAFRGQVSAAL
jgi:hypothetical protein